MAAMPTTHARKTRKLTKGKRITIRLRDEDETILAHVRSRLAKPGYDATDADALRFSLFTAGASLSAGIPVATPVAKLDCPKKVRTVTAKR